MRYSCLGQAGVQVSQLCLGTMIFGRQVEEKESIRIIHRAIDLGINFIDTADIYVMGRSETIVGKAIKDRREDIVLATKVYNPMGPTPNDQGLSRKHILYAIKASLKRLETDYIDLYQAHRFDYETSLKETLVTMTDLVQDGRIHYFGSSNFTAWQIEKALRVSDNYGLVPVQSSQPRYNILDRDAERELLPMCCEEGIGVIPYSPLAGGFLTGKYQIDKPVPEGTRGALRPDWMRQHQTELNYRILKEMKILSAETGLKLSQLSLAWCLANPAVTAPIIGASRIEQLEENMEVVEHPPSPNIVKRISDVSKPEWLQQKELREARRIAFSKQRAQYWQEHTRL